MHEQRERAESFGAVAEDYDRYRPSYPDALFDDLTALAPTDVLDVGCGTGKATTQLAARGLKVLGLEIDGRMATVARNHGLVVEVAPFESWDAHGRQFDLITAAQAWHWIDPDAGAAKAAALLRPGGTLAVFWNHDDGDRRFAEVYRTVVPELVADDAQPAKPTYAMRLAATGLFDVTTREYPWQRSYSADEWVGYVRTHSDHLALAPTVLHELSNRLRATIDAAGGTVRVTGGTYAILARRNTC